VTVAGEQADADGIAASHQPIAVVLDLVHPIGAGRRADGGGWKAGLNEAGRTGGQNSLAARAIEGTVTCGATALRASRHAPVTILVVRVNCEATDAPRLASLGKLGHLIFDVPNLARDLVSHVVFVFHAERYRVKRLGSPYRSGRSKDWLKFKNPAAPAVKREAEEDWGLSDLGRSLIKSRFVTAA
jgi:hypothetical protein